MYRIEGISVWGEWQQMRHDWFNDAIALAEWWVDADPELDVVSVFYGEETIPSVVLTGDGVFDSELSHGSDYWKEAS